MIEPRLRLALFFVALAPLVACTQAEGDLTPFPEQQTTDVYPKAPYGVKVGAVLKNYSFEGFVDSTKNSKTTQMIALADFYNPTGDGVYEKGSQYGEGNKKPTALFVDISAGWCQPCRAEAGNTLPMEHAELAPLGGAFLFTLGDGLVTGTPATIADLQQWTKKFKSNYPSIIDPTYTLSSIFEADAYPGNMIVDTRTMTICEIHEAIADPNDEASGGAAFWRHFARVVADANACNN